MSQAQHRPPKDVDDLFPGKYLKAGQLGTGKPTLTIVGVELEDLPEDQGDVRTRGTLVFKETETRMVINKTNMLCLRAMFGRELAKWKGRRVTLFAGQHAGEPAIRIWGSPELTAPIQVPIKLPKRKEYKHTLHPVGNDAKLEPTKKEPPP